MHAHMTAVTTQSNKIVSNQVKDNLALLQPSYRKKPNNHFGQANTKIHPVKNQHIYTPRIHQTE